MELGSNIYWQLESMMHERPPERKREGREVEHEQVSL